MFNFPQYLHTLHSLNQLVKEHKFVFGTCSGIAALQSAVQQFRTANAYIIASDVCTGGTIKVNGAWQQKRIFTFFVLKTYDIKDEKDREAQLDICRQVRRQFLSKFLYDCTHAGKDVDLHFTENQVRFDMNNIPSNEYPDLQLNNCCGLNVSVSLSEPIDISYHADEWDEPKP